jgi:cell division protein FtsW
MSSNKNHVSELKPMFDILKSIFSSLGSVSSGVSAFLTHFSSYAAETYTLIIRWILPALGAFILVRCVLPLFGGGGDSRPWGYLRAPDGEMIPLRHWENSIGRSRLSDIVINLPFISRSHAVLSCSDETWFISDLGAKGGVFVNGDKVTGRSPVEWGDTVSLAGYNLTLLEADESLKEPQHAGHEPRPRKRLRAGSTLALIVIFQLLSGLQECIGSARAVSKGLPLVMLVFICVELFHCIMLSARGTPCEIEMLAYYLCGIGLLVTASAAPSSLYKQLIAIIIGAVLFSVLLYTIGDLDKAAKLKKYMYGAAFVLMLLIIAIGQTRNGAKNWISLGGMTFQPMELVKIAFVFAGTATLDKLLTTKNLTSYILFSGACIGTLAITKDFGTALVFFAAFLVMAFMRSGDIRTIALILAGAVLGALAVISFFPYVSSRFSAWGHVWQHADTSGFQQTRTMIGIASGGLIGLGGGKGYLCKIAAADTDLAFGVICEELGLILALTTVLAVAAFALFSVLSARKCRSSFYAIAACGAATIFMMQSALNVFGSVDILPLTGVTLPFVSNGGTSMVTCWCLLAFIKSADERLGPDDEEADSADEPAENVRAELHGTGR